MWELIKDFEDVTCARLSHKLPWSTYNDHNEYLLPTDLLTIRCPYNIVESFLPRHSWLKTHPSLSQQLHANPTRSSSENASLWVPTSSLYPALWASKNLQKSTKPPSSRSLNPSCASSPSRSPMTLTSSSAFSPLTPQRCCAYCTTRSCRHGRSSMAWKTVGDLNSEPAHPRIPVRSSSFCRIRPPTCRLNIPAFLVLGCRCLHGKTPL